MHNRAILKWYIVNEGPTGHFLYSSRTTVQVTGHYLYRSRTTVQLIPGGLRNVDKKIDISRWSLEAGKKDIAPETSQGKTRETFPKIMKIAPTHFIELH